jgi:hypothetical protein
MTEMVPALDRIIRIRAVQELTPSQALAFILDLKQVVGEVAGEAAADELRAFEQRVDQLVLTAFDVYSECREQISSIRINEIRKRSLDRIERLNEWRAQRDQGDSDHDREPARDPDDVEVT